MDAHDVNEQQDVNSVAKLRTLVQATSKLKATLSHVQKSMSYVTASIHDKPHSSSLNKRKSVITVPSSEFHKPIDPRSAIQPSSLLKETVIPSIEQLKKEFPNMPERAINQCLVAFKHADYAQTGLLDKAQTHFALHQIGFMFTKEEVNLYFEEFDDSKDGNFNIREFLRMIDFHMRFSQEKKSLMPSAQIADADIIDAFVSMGGNPDKTGNIQWKRITYVIKLFALSVDVMALMTLLDTDDDGLVSYDEFSRLFSDFEDNDDVQQLLVSFRSPRDHLTPRGFF